MKKTWKLYKQKIQYIWRSKTDEINNMKFNVFIINEGWNKYK